LVRNGENGLLYRVANHAELAEKIHHLLEHPCLAIQLGDNGRRWAEAVFTRERYASELMRVLGSPDTSLASFPSASRS
jgi:glycosyltransferase involved in cell wall biosynthesis